MCISYLPCAVWQKYFQISAQGFTITRRKPMYLSCLCHWSKGKIRRTCNHVLSCTRYSHGARQYSGGFKRKVRLRCHCRWRGQLIFTEGHGLEPLFLVPFSQGWAATVVLIWKAAGPVCLFTALAPVKVTKNRTPIMSPKLAGKSSVRGSRGSSCHKSDLLQADTLSINSKLWPPELFTLIMLESCFPEAP